MSHLIWKRYIGKRSSQVCPLLPGSARQVGFLSPGFPSRSGDCRVCYGSKQYQSLSDFKEQTSKDKNTTTCLIFCPDHTAVWLDFWEKKVPTQHWKCGLQGQEYFTFCPAPQQLPALNTNLPHWCAPVQLRVCPGPRLAVCLGSAFCVKGKKEAAQN